jgi:hypothetical protein
VLAQHSCWLNIVAAAESGAEQGPHVIKDKSMGSKILLAKMFAKPTGGRVIAVLVTPAKSPAKRASATWQQRISRLSNIYPDFLCILCKCDSKVSLNKWLLHFLGVSIR